MSNPGDSDPPPGGPRTLDGRPADSTLPQGWGQPARRTGRIGDTSGGGGGRSGGIATLFNTGISGDAPPPHDHDDDGDDEDPRRRPEEFFAGGERSGLAVTNPDQPGEAPSDMVKRILNQAKQNGPTEPKQESAKVFTGSGNRLGSEDDPEPEPQAAGPSAPGIATTTPSGMDALLAGMFGRGAGGPPAPPEDEEVQVRRLTFWRNGFSIEDGPLLPYDTPENKELLEAVHAGRAPPSVFNVRWNQPLQVEVANRRNTDYQPPPKKPMQAFAGGGNRLGSPAPEVVSGAATPVVPGAMPAPSAAAPTFELDSSKPTTSIQVRLGDGTRLVARVNLTHTVGDLRNFVAAARPDARTFVLQTTFPSKELSDESQTVEDAKLQNAVVVQRFT